MSKFSKKILLFSIPVIIILIQFFRIDKSVPETDPAMDLIVVTNPPRRIASILKNSCYDCHSNKTRYPWYTGVAPISWFIQSHIREGREHLNFSEFGKYPREKRILLLSGMKEEIEEKEMPLRSYTLIHKNAKLADGMREALIRWLTSGKNDVLMP